MIPSPIDFAAALRSAEPRRIRSAPTISAAMCWRASSPPPGSISQVVAVCVVAALPHRQARRPHLRLFRRLARSRAHAASSTLSVAFPLLCAGDRDRRRARAQHRQSLSRLHAGRSGSPSPASSGARCCVARTQLEYVAGGARCSATAHAAHHVPAHPAQRDHAGDRLHDGRCRADDPRRAPRSASSASASSRRRRNGACMIADGRNSSSQDAWWISLFPGLAIVYVGITFTFLGDGLDDFLTAEGDERCRLLRRARPQSHLRDGARRPSRPSTASASISKPAKCFGLVGEIGIAARASPAGR